MEGTVFVNPSSGPGDTGADEVRAALPGVDVRPCSPEELPDAVSAEAQRGSQWVGAAGGDGTIRCAAERLVGTGVALLAVPAGTRNHFARQLGIETLDDAAAAIERGTAQPVDVGEVNGRVFVNNSSIGLYPLLVSRRERRYRHLPKAVGNAAALVAELRRGRTVDACVGDAPPLAAWMLFVGNDRYGDGLFELTSREALDEGVLDLRVVRADRPWSRLRVFGAAVTGRLHRSPLVLGQAVAGFDVDPGVETVDVALDGEVVQLTSPLRYRSRPGALLTLVPPGGYS